MPGRAERLGAWSLGFLTNRDLRRALAEAGFDIRPGPFSRSLDGVVVWGARPVAARALAAAARRGLPAVFVEDAFLRSILPEGREPLIGLTIDRKAPYFDASRPSDLEDRLNAAVPAAGGLVLDEYRDSGLSKYNDARLVPEWLEPDGFALVVDQRRGDASIRMGAADADSFRAMLEAALDENPDVPIFVKGHPRGAGHLGDDLPDRVRRLAAGADPVACLRRARSVYAVTSQLGFEAILHGRRPRVFGLPFYAGWGLSDDELTCGRRRRSLDVETLFQVVMQDYCRWFDPLDGHEVDLVAAMRGLQARARHRQLVSGIRFAAGMKRWKRGWVRKVVPGVRFVRAPMPGPDCVTWASAVAPAEQSLAHWRMEDGFLRSRGLGAALTPPGSVVLDDLGIYYDPSRSSRLERLIGARAAMPDHARERAVALRRRLIDAGLSKYNVGSGIPALSADGRRRILVPGQVEDDASVLTGCGVARGNRDLLARARAANPDAAIIYKPHPDVEAGLRSGAVPDVATLCDAVLTRVDPIAALQAVDEVWTLTSLLGFEAILRGKTVTCMGQPFYAGWGLTRDIAGSIARRKPVDLDALIHASLIDYPIYMDPRSGLILSVERFVDSLECGKLAGPGLRGRLAQIWKRIRQRA